MQDHQVRFASSDQQSEEEGHDFDRKTSMIMNNRIDLDLSRIKRRQSRKKKENTVPFKYERQPLPPYRKEESFNEFGMLDVSTVHYLKKCQLLS